MDVFDIGIAVRAAVTAARNRRSVAAARARGPVDVLLCVVDHFEPRHGSAGADQAHERVMQWVREYPLVAGRHRDYDGSVPKHGFFYPWDEFDGWELDRLAELCAEGWGEIELHLHHRRDTGPGLRSKIRAAVGEYSGRGALTTWPDGRAAFAFIHGNWALDNSRMVNGQDVCGVDDEITVLRDEGCYADFTFPAWRTTAQPSLVNTIFYANDDPARPKSHDRGVPATAGSQSHGDLLLVQGPLAPFLDRGSGRPRFAVDDGDISVSRRFTPDRLERWVRTGVHVAGRPDRVFVKVYCHGAPEHNLCPLLQEDLDLLFATAEERFNDGHRFRLRHTTPREMYNVIKATEAGVDAPFEALRDWVLPPPPGSGAA